MKNKNNTTTEVKKVQNETDPFVRFMSEQMDWPKASK